jgi:serine phosphatase RsbU (regulator of sigma subunit)
MFATFFYGVLDGRTATFTYTNAGHNPPLLCRAGGELEELRAGGLLLGMLTDQDYEQETVTLAPGDVVILFTDGITEAVGPAVAAVPGAAPGRDPSGPRTTTPPDGLDGGDDEQEGAEDEEVNLFGDEALAVTVQQHAAESAAQIKEAILAAVARHTAGTPQSDDITLVVIKRGLESETTAATESESPTDP